jgi:hypothetical protein
METKTEQAPQVLAVRFRNRIYRLDLVRGRDDMRYVRISDPRHPECAPITVSLGNWPAFVAFLAEAGRRWGATADA